MVVVRLISVVDWDRGVIDFCERVGSPIAFGACGERRGLSAVGTATWDFNCLTRPYLNLATAIPMVTSSDMYFQDSETSKTPGPRYGACCLSVGGLERGG